VTPQVLRACEQALCSLRERVPFDLGTVWVRGEDGLVPAASVGRPLDLLEGVPFRVGPGLRAWVLETGRCVRVPSRGRGFRGGALRGFLAVPAEHRGERVAVLSLARLQAAFADEDERRVREAAASLAQTLLEGCRA
jgi:hypothetical protein